MRTRPNKKNLRKAYNLLKKQGTARYESPISYCGIAALTAANSPDITYNFCSYARNHYNPEFELLDRIANEKFGYSIDPMYNVNDKHGLTAVLNIYEEAIAS